MAAELGGRPDESPGLDMLELRSADKARFWEAFLERPFDPDRMCVQHGPRAIRAARQRLDDDAHRP